MSTEPHGSAGAEPDPPEESGEDASPPPRRRRARRGAGREIGAHGHGHGPVTIPAAEARRVRTVLAALVVPLLIATIVGLIALWPRGETQIGSLPLTADGATFERGTVTDVPGELGAEIVVEVTTGEYAGRVVSVQAPPEVIEEGVEVGDEIRMLYLAGAAATGSPFVFVDFVRDIPVILLAVLYLLVVALVARWRGLAAVLGLGASLVIVGIFVIPALIVGTSPLLVALVGSSAMMFVAVYLAHGISIRTTTALLGTFAGLAITTGLGWWAIGSGNLVGNGSEEAYMVFTTFPGVSLSALLLCGIVIAGLGALNDVTITQASAVWELHASDPAAGRAKVFGRAMRIGRDHIASTVYTLAFAYVGTSLPLLMVGAIYDRTLVEFLMSGEIVEEVVRTLVSSIGLVLAIPATTAISALLVGRSAARK
ncbi:YibE/F family protein [Pseudactinotalea suaedae]|uniref:YibE/F family protein n=1 Tax=Pseudactinotalea suaedae TaxID=1524924 RepID=UPI001F4FDF47|nr:YibE/F family protein [Pseudactinotalea suaedae]